MTPAAEDGHHHDAEPAHDEAFWNERYETSERIWSGNPNSQLVAEVDGLVPGRALDVGCGEGADAIWLAQRGWSVVATDISGVALGRAAEHVRETDAAAAARIEWRHADPLGDTDALERDAFDLVSAQFMQLAPDPRARLFAALAASVRAGGVLLVVGHHPSDMTSGVHRPPQPERFYSADDIAGLLDDSWTIVVSEARPRSVTTHEGAEVTIHDAVLLAVRK